MEERDELEKGASLQIQSWALSYRSHMLLGWDTEKMDVSSQDTCKALKVRIKVCMLDQVSSTQAPHVYKGTGCSAHTEHCETQVRVTISTEAKGRQYNWWRSLSFCSALQYDFVLLWYKQAEDTWLLSLDSPRKEYPVKNGYKASTISKHQLWCENICWFHYDLKAWTQVCLIFCGSSFKEKIFIRKTKQIRQYVQTQLLHLWLCLGETPMLLFYLNNYSFSIWCSS